MQRRLGRFYLNSFRKILARQGKSGRFLEIGTGPGYQTAIIAEDYPEAEIVGLEPSPDMVRIATTYIADKGLSERVRFVEGAVEDEGLVAGLGTFEGVQVLGCGRASTASMGFPRIPSWWGTGGGVGVSPWGG